MRVGIISDTHIPEVARAVPRQVADAFRGVDLILHAGDIYSLSVLDDLERIAPVLACLGDDDHFSLARDHRVKTRQVLELEGHTVWVVHDKPFVHRSAAGQNAQIPDIMVHGHTHRALVWEDQGVLFVGPGSPTFLQYQRGLGTVAIMDLNPGGADDSIVKLQTGSAPLRSDDSDSPTRPV